MVEVLQALPGFPPGVAFRRHSRRSDANGAVTLVGAGAGPFWVMAGTELRDVVLLAAAAGDAVAELGEPVQARVARRIRQANARARWSALRGDRFATLAVAAAGTHANALVSVLQAETELASAGTQLFQWLPEREAWSFVGLHENGPVPFVPPGDEAFVLVGVAPDGAVGVLAAPKSRPPDSQFQLQLLRPGTITLDPVLRERAEGAGGAEVRMTATDASGFDTVRWLAPDTDWTATGVPAGAYRFVVQQATGSAAGDCRVDAGRMATLVAR
jgi:hypothetical protein